MGESGPGRKGGENFTGGGRKDGGKRYSQGGVNDEKLEQISKYRVTFSSRKAQRGENQYIKGGNRLGMYKYGRRE